MAFGSTLPLRRQLSVLYKHKTMVLRCKTNKFVTPSVLLNFSRGIKYTSSIHPTAIHNDDEKVLEKVLQERQNSEDLPETMTNPYQKPVKKCILCEYDIEPDYKNVKLLYQFTSPYTGVIYGRHITGLCKNKQKRVEEEINVALNLGLMSTHVKQVEFLKDPKLCDPDRPIKPHPY